jgi:hypothetical protein
MPLPTLSKGGVTTVTFSRGNVFPSVHDYEPVQIVGISYAGTRRVATIRAPDEFFDLVFERVAVGDYTAMLAFFGNALVNWSANSFTYTDSASVATTVRYLGGRFSFPEVAAGLYSGRIPLVKEVA